MDEMFAADDWPDIKKITHLVEDDTEEEEDNVEDLVDNHLVMWHIRDIWSHEYKLTKLKSSKYTVNINQFNIQSNTQSKKDIFFKASVILIYIFYSIA